MKYCPECASPLETRERDGMERQVCPAPGCGFVHWDNPVPVVAALIRHDDHILLARNAQWPKGLFSLISGYLERGEAPEAGVVREVKEETGLDAKVDYFLGGYTYAPHNQLILAHAVVASGELAMGDEIAEIKRITREELTALPFKHLPITRAIVQRWLEVTDRNRS